MGILRVIYNNKPYSEIEEKYSKEELDKMIEKKFNQVKVISISHKEKYDQKQTIAKVECTKCGRRKNVFLSNLIHDPEKYGSCKCSDTKLNSRVDSAEAFYKGDKILPTNTSGVTGVSFVGKYGGELYNKWRAYIEVDGKRTYLGDFDLKDDAIEARRIAGKEGVQWYKDHKGEIKALIRRKGRLSKKKLKHTNRTKTINI